MKLGLMAKEHMAMAFMLVASILLLAGVGSFIAYKHQWASQKLVELEPRYARLLGLEAKQGELERLEAQTRNLLSQYAYPAADDASKAGNNAQQRIRDVFSKAGLEVVSSQVLPAKSEKQFERIPLLFRIEGDLVGLHSSLAILQTESPAIMVDSIGVQPIGVVKSEAPVRLAAQFNLSVFRVK